METVLERKEANNDQITKVDIEIKDNEILKVTSYWTCDACGGDSETGCMMSDPDDCVRC
jgi:CTP:phosphocholine cytidylyltransferase-like protein